MTANRIIVGLSSALVMVGLFVFLAKTVPGTEYRTFTSPDGRFTVVVYRSRQWLGAMPGQAGDAPGNVCLYDATGKLVERKAVEMVQLVEQVTWTATNVDIKFVAEWELP
jgi:hypothetical protein